MRLSLESPVEEATDVPVTVAVSDGATRQVPFGSSGVEGACARRQGFLRELGRSGHFHGIPAVHRVAATSNTPAQRRRVGSSHGSEPPTQPWYRPRRRKTKPGGMNGRKS